MKINFIEYTTLLKSMEILYRVGNETWFELKIPLIKNLEQLLNKYGDYELLQPFYGDITKIFDFYDNTYCIISNHQKTLKISNFGDDEPTCLYVEEID